jgi:hypothetical protein
MTANRAASIRARLKQHTDTSKQDFNLTLTRYGLERLLYRPSISEHAPNLLLKGALLFQLWYGQPHRPTRDADLLGFGPDDVPTLVGVFRSLASIAADDGVDLDTTSVKGSPIRSVPARNPGSTADLSLGTRPASGCEAALTGRSGCGELMPQPWEASEWSEGMGPGQDRSRRGRRGR